ncbi:MAG TPA: macro domain-containing protein [bacterium]
MLELFLKRTRYFFSKDNLKTVFQNFFLALGILWLILEFSAFFFPNFIVRDSSFFYLAILISALWAIALSFPPISYSKESSSSNLKIEVKLGDIFSEPSNIAIGTSNYFDSEYPNIISEHCLKAQFIKRFYDGNHDFLDKEIEASLKEQNINGTEDRTKIFGKQIHYPIGTVAVVPFNNHRAFLSVFSEMQADKNTVISRKSIWESLCNLWDAVRRNKSLHSITIPVWGAGFGLAPANRISLIQLILTSFIMANKEWTVSQKLIIMIYEMDYNPREMLKIKKLIDTINF